jgi:glycosyltransferase involved in cell wall biosynthesis
MSPLRILFLITDLGRGGAERFLIDHCSALSNYPDIQFKIAVLYDNNQYPEDTKLFDIEFLDYATFSFFKSNSNLAYKKLLEDFKPNIIHTNRYLAEFLSSFYVDENITYVCHGHDNMIELANFHLSCLWNKPRLLNFLEKIYLYWNKYRKVNTYFIANSSHTYRYYQSALPSDLRSHVVRLDFGFNYTKFYQSDVKQIQESNKIQILNVGSFQHKKNQNFIIDIAIELLKSSDKFEIHLIGDGEYFETVKARVINEKLESFVFLHGIQKDAQDWYRKSDVYLHTAYYEPFGLVFLEAMAAGLPVVCLDGKGNRDIIDHGQNGFIFTEQNAVGFADAIISLKKDSSLYQRLSAFGKSFAKKFDLEIQTKKFVDFYYSILAKK